MADVDDVDQAQVKHGYTGNVEDQDLDGGEHYTKGAAEIMYRLYVRSRRGTKATWTASPLVCCATCWRVRKAPKTNHGWAWCHHRDLDGQVVKVGVG